MVDWPEIQLTPLADSDLDKIVAWQNSPDARDLAMGFRFPVQRGTADAWLASLRDQNGKTRVVYAIRQQGTLVGTIDLHSLNSLHRTCLLGVTIGDADRRGAGIGRIAVSLILDFAFNGLDMRRVGIEVLAVNEPANRLYRSLGFTLEGTKRADYFCDGKALDVKVYGMLQPEFDPVPSDANRLVRSFAT